MRYPDIFSRLSITTTLEELIESTCELFRELNIQHISLWGVDAIRKRVFFVTDISKDITIRNEGIRVLNYGQGFLGECIIDEPNVKIRKGKREIKQAGFIATEFIKKYKISTIMAIPRMERADYKSIFLLAQKQENKIKDTDNSIGDFVFLLDVFISQYARIKNKQYRELLLDLAERSLSEDTNEFLTSIRQAITQYFNADSFSVWKQQTDGKLHNLFFAFKDNSTFLTYEPGEGATGTCFSTSKSFLAHRMTDLAEQEGIPWKGKVSDFDFPAKSVDHGIFVPILSVKGGKETSGDPVGVLRIILSGDSNSFWPHDLETAQTLAKVIALRFSHDNVFNRLNEENNRLQSLLKLSGKVSRLGIDADFSKEAFDSLVSNYHLLNIAYVIYDILNAQTNIRFNNDFPTDQIEAYIRSAIKIKIAPNTRIATLPLSNLVILKFGIDRIEELKQLGIFIMEFSSELTTEDLTSLEVLSTVLEIAWENSRMFQERERLLEKWERVEAASRAGIISREFAHEVKQGCKSIFSWIANSQREDKGPNFSALKDHVRTLDQFAKGILNMSSVKYKACDCYMNNILRIALRSYGVKPDESSLQGHMLKVSYSPLLWEKNSPRYFIYIDPDAMISVIRNLLNNSIEQYSRFRKKGPIEISTELYNDNECKACLSIKDYAGGISPEMKNKMWLPFETDKANGSGIGLFSAETLVKKRMYGTIEEVGETPSAEFKITLRAKRGGN